MTTDDERTHGQVVELWTRAFGGPPPILVAPEQMMVLIEAHFAQTQGGPREQATI